MKMKYMYFAIIFILISCNKEGYRKKITEETELSHWIQWDTTRTNLKDVNNDYTYDLQFTTERLRTFSVSATIFWSSSKQGIVYKSYWRTIVFDLSRKDQVEYIFQDVTPSTFRVDSLTVWVY